MACLYFIIIILDHLCVTIYYILMVTTLIWGLSHYINLWEETVVDVYCNMDGVGDGRYERGEWVSMRGMNEKWLFGWSGRYGWGLRSGMWLGVGWGICHLFWNRGISENCWGVNLEMGSTIPFIDYVCGTLEWCVLNKISQFSLIRLGKFLLRPLPWFSL